MLFRLRSRSDSRGYELKRLRKGGTASQVKVADIAAQIALVVRLLARNASIGRIRSDASLYRGIPMTGLWAHVRGRLFSIPDREVLVATRGFEIGDPSKVGQATAHRTLPVDHSALAHVRKQLFGLDAVEASFARRGFGPAEQACQERLEYIGVTFIAGFNAAMRAAGPDTVLEDLAPIPAEFSGFAVEGAAMGFALLDLVSPWRSRLFARYLAGTADAHTYMAHVGAGWALARTSPTLMWRLGKLDPLLRWLIFDGYGFHAGYFHHRESIGLQRRPSVLRGYARNAFDQGLGRVLWFVKGADAAGAAAAVSDFPDERRADLWSGIGLAVAYAGGADADGLQALIKAAGPHRAALGQGAAFAAKARERAGNPARHTELACQTICGMAAVSAAAITDHALPTVGRNDNGEAYEFWRAEIRCRLEARYSGER